MKAILFDMDGVLIDSEIYYMEGTFDWMKECGFQGTFEEVCTIIGTTMQRTYEMIYEMLEGRKTLDEVILMNEEYFTKNRLDYGNLAKPGALNLLKELKEKGYKLAICSSSSANIIQEVVDECGFKPYLDFIVSGEQFKQSKPHPEIYFHAAEVLEVLPEECLVVEDSEYGIQAGISAGMKVVALCDERLPNKQEKAHHIIKDLSEVHQMIEKYI